MRGNTFLDKMELIDPAYVEAADTKPEYRKNPWVKWVATVASFCLILGAAAALLRFGANTDPQPGELVLSNQTTAKVSYGYDGSQAAKQELVYLTEEELFAREKMYVFRGRVSELTNVTIDFNGAKEARCIATIVIDKVYQGELTAGEQITMLIPCAIGSSSKPMEDSGIIAQLEIRMEGIFMPWVYDENSFMEMNGAVLMMQDLASCGLADGMRWVFLSVDSGVCFFQNAYPGAKDATSLDEIEAYVIEMLQ